MSLNSSYGLILLPLLLLIFSALLSVAVMAGDAGFSAGSDFSYNDDYAVNGSQTLDDVSSDLAIQDVSMDVSITLGTGLFAWVASSVAFAGIFGIQVLGSGLAEISVMALARFASLYAVWFLFSFLASPLFLAVWAFGVPLYFILTFFYSFGIVVGGLTH